MQRREHQQKHTGVSRVLIVELSVTTRTEGHADSLVGCRVTHSIRVGLVGLQLLVVGELDVYRAAAELGSAVGEVGNHLRGHNFIRHLQKGLRRERDTKSAQTCG